MSLMIEKLSEKEKRNLLTKPILFGVVGGMTLLIIYWLILSIANSFNHALSQFFDMWYWIVLLTIGFGTQIGLYTYIKNAVKLKSIKRATSTVATSGGMSAVSMVACCAHHLTDVLPLLGLSAAAVFLNKYQTLFIILGILSNIIGINLMLKIVQEHRLYIPNGSFDKLSKISMKKAFRFTLVSSVIIFLSVLFNTILR